MKHIPGSTTRPNSEYNEALLIKRKRTVTLSAFYSVVILSGYVILSNIFQANHVALINIVPSMRWNSGSLKERLSDINDGTDSDSLLEYEKYPSEPIYHIQSILNASIGNRILNDPSRNPLRDCSPTVQYRLLLPPEQSQRQTQAWSSAQQPTETTWILQSMMMIRTTTAANSSNTNERRPQVVPKPYGGDEIYVQWETDPKAGADSTTMLYDYMGIAQVTDRNDGTYLLKFIRPPMLQFNYTRQQQLRSPNVPVKQQQQQYGRLTIFYEYTCGIGSIFAPNKDQYARGGEVFQTLTTTQLVPRPYIHDFVPPNTAIGDDAASSDASSNINEMIDLSKYDTVFAFGDSLIMQLVRRYLRKGTWSDNIIWHRNVYQCLSTDSDARSMLYKFHTQNGEHIQNLTQQSKRIALLTGSSSWDAMRGCVHEDMKDHVNAIRTYIQNVTTSFPNLDVYWKAPSALFLHRYTTYKDAFNDTFFRSLKPRYGVKPLKPRYINYHVPKQLYHVQKELMMREFQIPLLDLYDSYYLSAPWTVPGDGRHFDDALTRLQLSYFWPGLLDKPIYT
jgi:hypothetical protein